MKDWDEDDEQNLGKWDKWLEPGILFVLGSVFFGGPFGGFFSAAFFSKALRRSKLGQSIRAWLQEQNAEAGKVRMAKPAKTRKRNSKKDKREVKAFRNGAIAFGITAMVYASLFEPSRLVEVLLMLGVSLGIGKLVQTMSRGLDLTTHNKQDAQKRAQQELQQQMEDLSKNDTTDGMLMKARDMLQQIRDANDAIPDADLSNKMDELERLSGQLFKTVVEKPEHAGHVRKYLNYYLPTTLNMLQNYSSMQKAGVSQHDLDNARFTLSRALDMVLGACQKQIDHLYSNNVLDISTDVTVLEQMLRRDGLMDSDLVLKTDAARSATAHQLAQGVPVLQVEEDEDDPADADGASNAARR